MLKYCTKCGTFHDHNFKHKDTRQKKNNDMRSFYSGSKWTELSKRIKERDNHLCQMCLLEEIYTTEHLEVHHIEKAEANEEKRYDETNLITLCTKHHKEADAGAIDNDILFELVCDKYF